MKIRLTAVDDDLELVGRLLDDAQRVDEGGQCHNGRTVLVVVKDRDVEGGAKRVLDLEATRRGDVLQVDAAKRRCYPRDRVDDGLCVRRVEGEREGVDAGELLEEGTLSLHHRHRRLGPDVTKTEDGRAVGHDSHRVLLDRECIGALRSLVNRHAHARNARGVHHGQIVAGPDWLTADHLDLPAQVQQKRPVRVMRQLEVWERLDRVDDRLRMVVIAAVDREVSNHHAVAG